MKKNPIVKKHEDYVRLLVKNETAKEKIIAIAKENNWKWWFNNEGVLLIDVDNTQEL